MNDNELEEFLKIKFRNCNNKVLDSQVDNIIGGIFQKRRKKKKVLLMSIPIILTSTVAFAIGFTTFNLSSVGIDDSCLEIAAKNGYMQTLDTEKQYFNGLGINIKQFLIDDINMDISFEYATDSYNVDDIKNIFIQDLKIYDNASNILYAENNEMSDNNIAETMGYTKIEKISSQSFRNTFFTQSDSFPNSKEIYIEFSKVILNCKKQNITVNGNWKFKIEVADEMVERNNIEYKAISSNNNGNIIIRNLKITNTGLITNITAKNSEILNKCKITLLVNDKKINANNNVFEKNYKNINEYVEQIYTFNLTKYDAPNEIVVKIKENNEEKNILFIKEKE